MKIVFVNGRPLDCGCHTEYSDGYGMYSNVTTVYFCKKHSEMLGNHEDHSYQAREAEANAGWVEYTRNGPVPCEAPEGFKRRP